jgi:hypothetical protein
MCYSYEQSRNNFIINIITSYILYTYKNKAINKIIALILGYIGIMQLFDMIFWSTQNIKDPFQAKLNYITTKIAMFVNHLQPVVISYIIYSFTGKLGMLSLLILLIYILAMILYTYNAYYKIDYTLVKKIHITSLNNADKQATPYLEWRWNIQSYYTYFYILFILALIILSYENLPNPYNKLLAAICLISFIFSRLN